MKPIFLTLMLAAPLAVAQDRAALPLPPPGHVTLPLDEYNKLQELASRPAAKPDKPLMPFSIRHADLKFEVAGDAAAGSIQFEGEVFQKGVVKVPLLAGVMLLDARRQGRELALQHEGGVHAAFIPGPADFSINVTTSLRVVTEPGRASVRIPSPSAGTVELTLVVPGNNTNVNLQPGLVTSRSSANGRTTIVATLASSMPANIWWTTREGAPPVVPREIRFLSDIKTLVSVGESQIGVAVLADVTVLQGDPSQFEMPLPAGYELTGANGASLESSSLQAGSLILKVRSAAARSHQFLISFEKSINAGKVDVPFLSLQGSQRETGELLVEGEGTMELTARESGGLKRMDLKETSSYLRSLAHASLDAAFRYHRQPAEPLGLALEWVRFPDSKLPAAVAQQAVVTTMVTTEGKSLTEVRLVLRNQAQPFLKVALPAGVGILSADVGGERVKPLQGPDGNRVPLLRPGFRPADTYTVSFVFLHSGAPFAKKGGSEIALPKMDIPIGLLQWEIFLPPQYKVRDFGGDATLAGLMPSAPSIEEEMPLPANEISAGSGPSLAPGQLGGMVSDPSGAAIPRAHVTVVHLATGAVTNTYCDPQGRWIAPSVPAGTLRITVEHAGFRQFVRTVEHSGFHPTRVDVTLGIGSVSETVEVTSSTPEVRRDQGKAPPAPKDLPASTNVVNLQRRVAGVLPIAVEVPRAGSSYRFVRPLVIDEETKLTFSYRTK